MNDEITKFCTDCRYLIIPIRRDDEGVPSLCSHPFSDIGLDFVNGQNKFRPAAKMRLMTGPRKCGPGALLFQPK